MNRQRPPSRRRPLVTVAGVVAVVGQLIVLVPFTVASGLVAPLGGVVALYVVWAAFAAGLYLLWRRHPVLTPLVPLANLGVLLGVITLGERVLGWSA